MTVIALLLGAAIGLAQDVRVTAIAVPGPALDSGTIVVPACTIYNHGSAPAAGFMVRMKIGANYDRTSLVPLLLPGATEYITFPEWAAQPRDTQAVTCSTELTGDLDPANDARRWSVFVRVIDFELLEVVSPGESIETGKLYPFIARLRNHSNVVRPTDDQITIVLNFDKYKGVFTFTWFGDTVTIIFDSRVVSHDPGSWPSACTLIVDGDLNLANNVKTGTVVVHPPAAGWAPLADLPLGPKGKRVKDGGALAFKPDTTGEYVYALKGNGTYEFYRHNIGNNTWTSLDSVPAIGRAGKKKAVKKGSAIGARREICILWLPSPRGWYCAILVIIKGNNSTEAWKYDPRKAGTGESPWDQLADVPAGAKNVKEGAGVVVFEMADSLVSYLLKGSGTQEFYRYNGYVDVWERMADAPLGASGKPWKNGSAIAVDESTQTIYALKGSYNELHAYDVATNTWTTRRPLPLVGTGGKKKKVKDGAGLAWLNGVLYAQKGGNTRELWAWYPAADTWVPQSDVPSADGKNVKGGGALTAARDRLFSFKGNNSLEFSRFVPTADGTLLNAAAAPAQSAGLGPRSPVASLSISPSPVRNSAHFTYALSFAGNVSLKLYDISGKAVMTLAEGRYPAGSHSVTIHNPQSSLRISSGLYFARLEVDGTRVTEKLILTR